MKILVACEESQEVCKAFRAKGHEAYSCDFLPCSGFHPEWHIQLDVFNLFNCKKFSTQNLDIHYINKWDLIILHPSCTYTAISGNRWYWNSQLRIKGAESCKNMFDIACLMCDKVALEQPKTIMQRYIGKKSQVIQPWQFGHGETKETWLWLKNLPLLKPTNIVEGREQRIWKMSPGKERSKLRSKTYPGIAKAMAEQWG
jgi:hypothetical protein